MDFQTYTKIFKIFVSKGWTSEYLYETPLDNLCELATNLNKEEVSLLIELIERYNWLNSNKFNGLIVSTLKKIEKKKIEACNKMHLFPIQKPNDEGKTKSGDSLVYNIRGVSAMVPEFGDKKIGIINSFSDFAQLNVDKNEIILLVDDFLGSGDTFNRCLEKILEINSSIAQNLHVFAIAIHTDALRKIESLKIPTYYGHWEKKGISDYYDGNEAMTRVDLMTKLEKRLKINPNYSLGYGKSEALITLIRTPNNTFPIFWDNYEIKGEKKKAPFPRY